MKEMDVDCEMSGRGEFLNWEIAWCGWERLLTCGFVCLGRFVDYELQKIDSVGLLE